MVDNFDKIREYMERQLLDWKEGDCYYVQLLRRQSDDPMIDGQKDLKYNGNMHSRSIKDYLVKSIDHLNKIEDDIKLLCKTFNVRAYISLNKRNYKQIAMQMMKQIAEQAASGDSFSSPFKVVSSAAGLSNCAGKNKTWLLDIDKEYVEHEQEIIDMILECEPYKSRIDENVEAWCGLHNEVDALEIDIWKKAIVGNIVKNEFFVVPSKSGEHIICKPFNVKQFEELWNNSSMKDMKVFDIHKDNPTVLFVP